MPAAIVCIAAVIVLLIAEYRQWPRVKTVAKLMASAAFIVFALSQGALASSYGQLVLLALVLCACGDALLLAGGLSRSFLLGIAAFALAHIVYCIAFASVGFDPRAFAIAAMLLSIAGVLIVRWLLAHMAGRYRLAIPGYVGVLLAMVATAAAATFAGGSPTLLVGAAGFALSDIAVARNRFVQPGFINRAWGLPLYFGAQLLLAASV